MTYTFDEFKAGKLPPKGWDVADAVGDGWTKGNIDGFLRATVRPWTPPDDTPPKPTPPDDTPPEPELAPVDLARNWEPDPTPTRTYDELLHAAHELNGENIAAIEGVLRDARELPSIRQDHILRVVKSSTGLGITALRKQMKAGDPDEERGVDHLELARRSVANIGPKNIICAGPFVWMWSDKGVWRQQDDRAVKQRVQRTIEGEGLPVNSTLVNGVTEVLKTEIFREEHRFNLGHAETINCTNGELVLDGGAWTLSPHDRDHFRTTQIPVAYDGAARAPKFETYLGEVFADDEDRDDKMRAVLELMGYTLMSHARHELFVILIGNGANGKSVLLHVLEQLCGIENVAGVQPSNFDRSFQRAHLHEKLANIVTEIKQGETIADAELKGIVSGEKSTVEHKFQDPFDMHPFATCWFGTNHMPHTRDFSDALFRRALILTFNRTFQPHEKNPALKSELEAELPGILNLALEAYARATRKGFTSPASSEEAKKEWRLEADQIAMFVEDRCTAQAGSREAASDLFQSYKSWAYDNGITKTMSVKGLRDRLTKLGFGAHRDASVRYVTGIRIGVSFGETDYGGW